MVFKLVRTDVVDALKIELPVGEHLFGRGKFLDCEDKRISRKHGQLHVTMDTVTLKALHQNPCFYTKSGSKEVTMLTLDSTAEISHGDRFGLLPTSYWYELLYCTLESTNHSVPNHILSNSQQTLPETQLMENTELNVTARCDSPTYSQGDDNPGDDSELLDINFDVTMGENRVTAESPSLIDEEIPQATSQVPDQSTSSILAQPPPIAEPPLIPDASLPSSSPSKRPNPESPEECDVKKVKTEPQEGVSNDASGTSMAGPSNPDPNRVKTEPPTTPTAHAPPAARERCLYGARCYRKNPQHKADFSHPTDSDWGNGELGVCPYGAGCTKRDPRHWQTHTHPQGTTQPQNRYAPGMRVVQRHGNTFYINAHTVNFYDDHFQAEDSDGDSVDYDYEF